MLCRTLLVVDDRVAESYLYVSMSVPTRCRFLGWGVCVFSPVGAEIVLQYIIDF
jgi:hypothetical protein